MSYIFEGIFCKTSFDKVQSINNKISSSLKLNAEKINDYLCCYSVVEDKRLFSSDIEIEYVASQISIFFNQATLVRYDDRVGYRESIVFEEGYPIKKFDLSDEIWVMTDEKGEAIVNGQKIDKKIWKEIRSIITRPR